ncbi:MAG TPA: TlpA disulfide reductase family protein [Pyrinomonadaceae bacterium]|nr:TlpA disulfide reductase family protein [Pyrinomonadaceae bacterium]
MKRFLQSLTLSLLVVSFGATAARAQSGEPQAGRAALKLEGQIVCSVCWFESDDRAKTPYGTADDIKCAADCAAKGIDAALAVREGGGDKFTLYLLEDGRFDKGAKNWLAYMGKRVQVAGTLRRGATAEKSYFKVDDLSVVGGGADASVLQDAKVIGTEVDFALKDLFGVEQRLSAFRGRIVVLNFWATYCEPCRREMPDLARIQNNYAALGVQVVGASADELAARTKVMEFIRETKINFPVWLGAKVGDMQRFGLAPALPGTVIIGRDGRVAWQRSGIVKEADLKQKIDELLAQAATATGREAEDAKHEAGDAKREAGDTKREAEVVKGRGGSGEGARVESPEEEHASSVPS